MAMEVKLVRGQGRMQHVITIGKHRLLTDVSDEHGGDDTGPEPHDLLAAALGACTAITLRMYAQRKQMDLQDIDVRVVHSQDGDAYVFTRQLQYFGNLNEAERARLTEIADKCPVHRTLLGQIRIVTHVTPAES
jgi:putative redox protein